MFTSPPVSGLNSIDPQDAVEIAGYLAEFFKKDPEKIALWMLLDNPMFGGISPAALITLGRGKKVLEYVRACKKENDMLKAYKKSKRKKK